MVSLSASVALTGGVMSALGTIIAVVVTCAAASPPTCDSGAAGGGFAVAVTSVALLTGALMQIMRGVSKTLDECNRALRSVADLDADGVSDAVRAACGILGPSSHYHDGDADEEAEQEASLERRLTFETPQYHKVDEIAALQEGLMQVASTMENVMAFIPQSIFRKVEPVKDPTSGSTTTGPSGLTPTPTADGRQLPIDMQSATTLGKQSMQHSSTATMNSAAVLCHAQFSTALVHRRISVLCVNIRSFRHAFGDGAVVDDVLLTLAEYISTVEQVVREHRGSVDVFHGDHVMISFNSFNPVSQHTRRAVQAALAIANRLDDLSDTDSAVRRLDVASGVSTGNAFVGNVGCGSLRRPSIIGSVFIQAVVLQRLAKLYFQMPKKSAAAPNPPQSLLQDSPQSCRNPGGGVSTSPAAASLSPLLPMLSTSPLQQPLHLASGADTRRRRRAPPVEQVVVQHHVAMDCNHDFVCQALDVAMLPGIGRRHLLWAVYSPSEFEEFQMLQDARKKTSRHRSGVHDQEWMYLHSELQDQNPFLNLNSGFEELMEGNLGVAREFLAKHKDAVKDGRFPEPTEARAAVGEQQLAVALEVSLASDGRVYERDLGLFYNSCVR